MTIEGGESLIKKIKKTQLRVLKALLRNSKASDQQIAREIGVSQPTVTRARATLLQEEFIRGYTSIPNLSKVGYEILAFTVTDSHTIEEAELELDDRVILAVEGLSEDGDILVVSAHKNYADYTNFARKYPVCYSFKALASEKPIKKVSLSQLVKVE